MTSVNTNLTDVATGVRPLSYLPWFEVFYKLLNILADYTIKGQVGPERRLSPLWGVS